MIDRIEEALPRERLPDDEQPAERDYDPEHDERADIGTHRARDFRRGARHRLERDCLPGHHRLDRAAKRGNVRGAVLQPNEFSPKRRLELRMRTADGGRKDQRGVGETLVDHNVVGRDADADDVDLEPGP